MSVVTLLKRRQKELAQRPSLPSLPICEVVFVLGGPGAGKGTQCQLLEERLEGWVHLSTGELLRAERKSGGELGDIINAKIDAGELVPSSITVKCLEQGMIAAFKKDKSTKFLIDGFPRSKENMQAELVPSSITVKCLEQGMIAAFKKDKSTKFLIDGFPRSKENMQAWDKTMNDHTIKFVLDFECPEEVLVG
eukprot:CAMPEP_0178890156 /NCGR_PEP_ID=MMETSP0747-20121128/18179_1 /TAXON_ID=913974 /ORGANISM="Nitzschia punctata, Strain CCMP561" /LENGTH=192 /DNA_ID=CAMNT_0020559763 /DNA_START=274 /DNA_END=848 /DNA_ORIENTATION=+